MSDPQILQVGNATFVQFEPMTIHNASTATQIKLNSDIPSIDFHYATIAAGNVGSSQWLRQSITEKVEYHVCATKEECQKKYDGMIDLLKNLNKNPIN